MAPFLEDSATRVVLGFPIALRAWRQWVTFQCGTHLQVRWQSNQSWKWQKNTKDSQSLNRQCLILTYFLHYVSYYVLQVYNPQFSLYYNPVLCHFTKRRHTRHEPHTYRSYSICSLALNRFVQRFFKHNKLGWFILNLYCIYIKYMNIIFEYHVISL